MGKQIKAKVQRAKLCKQWPRCACIAQGYENSAEAKWRPGIPQRPGVWWITEACGRKPAGTQ